MSTATDIEILGIGNAIVDVLSYCDDKELTKFELKKAATALIDEKRAAELYAQIGDAAATECSGGSAANTVAALASLGANCAFIGKVRDDQLGDIFRHDMQSVGVAFDTAAATEGLSTAHCLVYVTPDAQRTMATYLGACTQLTPQDIDPALVRGAAITYIEGYLWDEPEAIKAIGLALAIAKEAERQVAFTLSDVFCVARHREAFLALAEEVDILFANEAEIMALFETSYLDEALPALRALSPLAVITRSEKGALIATPHDLVEIPTEPVSELIDTTGAGDLFAAGFLYGVVRDWPLEDAARLGNRCAGRIIQQLGARSLKPLTDLIELGKAA